MNIDIYVDLQGGPLRLLRIPQNEIVEFGSQRPHAFLRYSLFAICGRKGHLCFDVAGHRVPVDYDSQVIQEKYIYVFDSSETPHAFIDLQGLHDQTTSSAATPRWSHFCAEAEERDGCCVLTDTKPHLCRAAHIVPHSKGNEYISKISSLRSHLYPGQEDIKEIDSITNAIFLRQDLHTSYRFGDYGFVRLPNFAMTCSDLPSNSTDSVLDNRITLVRFVAERSNPPPPGTGSDGRFTFNNANISLPSPMLLDFHFGVAFYKQWHVPEGDDYLGEFRKDQYENIPIKFTRYLDPCADDEPRRDGGSQDPSRLPSKSARKTGPGKKRIDQSMDQAMDDLLYLNMALQGLTPKVMRDMEKRRQEEEQLKSQQKVLNWMEAAPPDSAQSP